jgi:DNA invertase Pin-like site-specific DNA recombinase
MTKAYNYARFSSDMQRHGTSIKRQQDAAREWCKKNDAELVEEFADEAISAFRGVNQEDGALGVFIAMVDAGKIEPESYLVIEHFDRMSRDDPWNAVTLLKKLVKDKGIRVVTLKPRPAVYDSNSTGTDLQRALGQMDAAHAESENKSNYGKGEWLTRFRQARESKHHVGAAVSKWLVLKDEKDRKPHETAYKLCPARAPIVREIFDLYVAGNGNIKIAKILNERNVPRFGRGVTWQVSTIGKIIKSKVAIGVFEPDDNGPAIPDYFPAVVSEDIFNRANRAVVQRRTCKITRQAAVFNVYQKVARCGACGSSMHLLPRGAKYLMCSQKRYSRCDGAKNVRLDESEEVLKAILPYLESMSLVDDDPDKLERELQVLENQQSEAIRRYESLRDQVRKNPTSDMLVGLAIEAETEVRALEDSKRAKVEEMASVKATDHRGFMAKLDFSDEAVRQRVNALLMRLKITVHMAQGYVVAQNGIPQWAFAVADGKIGYMPLECTSSDDIKGSQAVIPGLVGSIKNGNYWTTVRKTEPSSWGIASRTPEVEHGAEYVLDDGESAYGISQHYYDAEAETREIKYYEVPLTDPGDSPS